MKSGKNEDKIRVGHKKTDFIEAASHKHEKGAPRKSVPSRAYVDRIL